MDDELFFNIILAL